MLFLACPFTKELQFVSRHSEFLTDTSVEFRSVSAFLPLLHVGLYACSRFPFLHTSFTLSLSVSLFLLSYFHADCSSELTNHTLLPFPSHFSLSFTLPTVYLSIFTLSVIFTLTTPLNLVTLSLHFLHAFYTRLSPSLSSACLSSTD